MLIAGLAEILFRRTRTDIEILGHSRARLECYRTSINEEARQLHLVDGSYNWVKANCRLDYVK